MKIHRTINKIAFENTYYLENDQALILVDPGSDKEVIERKLTDLKKTVKAILLTHTHYDHIMSLEYFRQLLDYPPVYVSEKEASWLYQPKDNLSGLARHDDLPDVICQPADHFFQTQKNYDISDFHFYVLETPGHSIGSLSFVFPEDHLVLTGDALFKETIGRCDLPTGDFATLIQSIEKELMTLPSHYQVYPGHGSSTSIHHERLFNPYLQGGQA